MMDKLEPFPAIPLGAKAPLNTQDIRDRISVAQKEADRHMPQVLDRYALFLTILHDALTGRVAGICFAIRSDSKKVGEALRGEVAWTVFTLFKIMDMVPDIVIPAFGWVFRPYGYRVVKDVSKSSPVSAKESLAGVIEAAGELEASAVRSLTMECFVPRLKRQVRQDIDKVDRALTLIRPHVEEVA